MKAVLTYALAADGFAKIPAAFPGHRARLDEFHARGVLLMAGPIGKPPKGALGVFTSREAAQEFVDGDPFVLEGVVSTFTIDEWDEVFV
ncbi:MAG: YciI family protein [Polyangiales bacterium]